MTQRTFAQHAASARNLRPSLAVDLDLKLRFASRKHYLTRKPTVKPLDREIAWAKARTEEAVTRYHMANETHAALWLSYAFGMPADIANQHIAMFGGVRPFGLTPLPPGTPGNDSWLELVTAPTGDIPFGELEEVPEPLPPLSPADDPDYDDEDTVPYPLPVGIGKFSDGDEPFRTPAYYQ